MIREPAGVGILLFDPLARFVHKQAIEDVRRFAHRRRNVLGGEWPELVGDMAVGFQTRLIAVFRIDQVHRLDFVRKPEMARHLREKGVFKINIGLESGSEPALQHMKGPKDSVAANYEALKLVRDQGIHVYGSFVLGTEMETPETLRETVDWIKRIIDEDLISDVEAQPILPLYNNHYGNVLFADYVP